MRRVRLRAIAIVVAALFSFGSSSAAAQVPAQAPPQSAPEQSENLPPVPILPKAKPQRLNTRQKRNLRLAEALGQRFVQRLKETMDVDVVYREMVVPNAIWRHRMSDSPDIGNAFSEELMESCDDENMERYALAVTNLMWAYSSYLFNTQDLSEIKEFDKFRAVTPDDVLSALARTKFLAPLGEASLNLPKLETREDVITIVREAEELREIILKHIPADAFESATYRNNIKYLSRNKNRASTVRRDVDHLYSNGQETELYCVWADFLHLGVVEHEGELKVLNVFE
jgi:hypothetical protein